MHAENLTENFMVNQSPRDRAQAETLLKHAIAEAIIVLRGLLTQRQIKIHELVQDVARQSNFVWADDVLLSLYQKQFITQAALCELYYEFASNDSTFELCFTPIAVYLNQKESARKDSVQTNSAGSDTDAIREYDIYAPNTAFYLNYDNFFAATAESVSELLKSFWQTYEAFLDKSPALKVLGLDETADWSSIQIRYRKLAKQYHPDKGGDTQKFIQVRQAFESLKRAY